MSYASASYLRNLRMLTPHDEEYQRVTYMLRASLSSLTVKLLSIHAVNSPQQDATFEANHVGTTVLDSWVNGTDLPEENTVHNIISHGGRFRIMDANKGAVFSAGLIGLDVATTPPGPQQYEMVLCRIATGRSFVVDPEQVGAHGIPAGYDSIAIHSPQDANTTIQQQNGELPASQQQYFHEYVINDESRVYPSYVVNYVFDAAADRMKEVPLCEACDTRAAVVYCMQDNAKLCEFCDRDMHAKSRIYERHNRVKLNEMQQSVGLTMCREHTNVPVQFFDPVSHVPVCVQCSMNGSHSTGENARHALVDIQVAFQASMDDMEKERQIVEERRRTIQAQLGSIDRRMTSVNANHERAQDEIFEIVQRAVQVLHEETQSKLSALLSDENELRRQLEYYSWMESFLNYQRTCVNPVEFLGTFKNHSGILSQAPSEIVDGGANVHADIRVVGRLEVVVDDTNPALQSVPGSGSAVNRGGGGGGVVPQGSQMQPQQSARGMNNPQQPMNNGTSATVGSNAQTSNANPRFNRGASNAGSSFHH